MHKKIVFFLDTKGGRLAGAQKSFLDLALYAAKDTSNETFFMNRECDSLKEEYASSNVKFINIDECNFMELEKATFIVPINYLFFLLVHIMDLKEAKLFLYNYDETAIRRLCQQIKHTSFDKRDFVELLTSTKGYAFIDKRAHLYSNDYCGKELLPNYLPLMRESAIDKYKSNAPLVDAQAINIGWHGNINSKSVKGIINIITALNGKRMKGKVNFHIIGKPGLFLKENISGFAPKTRFIFAGELDGQKLETYIRNEIDILCSYGAYAIEVSTFGVPIIIPSVNRTNNKTMYFYNARNFDFYLENAQIPRLNYTYNSMRTVLKQIRTKREKNMHAKKCYDFCVENLTVEVLFDNLIKYIDSSDLTLRRCKESSYVMKHINDYNRYTKKNKNGNYESFIKENSFFNSLRDLKKFDKAKKYLKKFLTERKKK